MNIAPRAFALVACLALNLATAHAQTAPAAPARAVMPPRTTPQIDTTFAAWDSNHNGSLSLDEFRAGATGIRTSMVDRRLHAQFATVDADRNGALDASEYAKLVLVKRMGASAPPLSTFDANRDQRLNFAEYTDLVRRLTAAELARSRAAAPGARAPTAPAPAPVQK
jgi:hypothetical protein